jgi:hypothetical protein
MPMRVRIDVARLFSLWHDESLTRAEVARELGVTGQLTRLASRHGLGARGRTHRAFSMADPTPDEIVRMAAAIRAKNLAELAAEPLEVTQQRVACQRRRGLA